MVISDRSNTTTIPPARRFDSIEISLIRQISALATPRSINLGLGEPDTEPDAELREMARSAAAEGSWRYTPNAGALALREAIAARQPTAVDPLSEVCVTAGTQVGLYAIAQAYIEAGDEVLVPEPGFPAYEVLVRLAGGRPVPYRLSAPDWLAGVEAIEERITSRTKAIVVNSPSNPTGAVIGRESLEAIAGLASSRGLIIISDEIYEEIHHGVRPPSMLGLSDATIVVTGLSKSHAMTGLRLGWVIAPAPLMKPIITAHQYIATCASAFSQTLAQKIFANETWNRRWLEDLRAGFSERRAVALNAVTTELGVHVAPPGGAFYLFVPIPVEDSLRFVLRLATEADVLAIPGVAFGDSCERHLRISYAAPPSEITKGVKRIAELMRDWKG